MNTSRAAARLTRLAGSGANQQFQLVPAGSYFTLRARHSGKCLTVVGSSTADGAVLEQRTCGTAAGFQWSRG